MTQEHKKGRPQVGSPEYYAITEEAIRRYGDSPAKARNYLMSKGYTREFAQDLMKHLEDKWRNKLTPDQENTLAEAEQLYKQGQTRQARAKLRERFTSEQTDKLMTQFSEQYFSSIRYSDQ